MSPLQVATRIALAAWITALAGCESSSGSLAAGRHSDEASRLLVKSADSDVLHIRLNDCRAADAQTSQKACRPMSTLIGNR